MKNGKSFIAPFLMCLATAVLTLAVVSLIAFSYFGGSDGFRFITKLNTVREIVDTHFVADADWDEAADGAARGIIASLGDEWSYYMTTEEKAAYMERFTNTSTGIGVTVRADEQGRGLYIEKVTPGTPAESAGLQSGYILISVAEQSIAGLSASDVSALIKSQSGEYVIGFIDLDGNEQSAIIQNGSIYTSPVSFELLENGIGYIQISDFEKGAAEDSVSAVETLRAQGTSALIFDVRSNPGGQLTELIGLLDYLLPEGELFVSVSSDGEEEIYYSEPGSVELPMVVLINGNSYSAAEFFAAAMREYESAVLIGEASTGKGRSQQTFTLTDGSAVHISTREYLTPGRVNLAEEGGLVPDIELVLTEEYDNQLQAAIEYLS